MTLVSVVIPTRNRSALLKEAIESVLSIERKNFGLDVIVVDDGSTDDTANVIEQYPVIHLRGQGLGASGARNLGISHARGEYVAFLDDDDVWLPRNITPQLEAFSAQPSYGAVIGRVMLTGPDRVPLGKPIPSDGLERTWSFEGLLGYWPQLGSVVVRRSVFHEVGLFDVTLRFAEDWDLILRIARRYQVGRISDITVLFRQRGTDDEMYRRKCLSSTIQVFHRHTNGEPVVQRLWLRRKLWHHRGWYAASFLQFAEMYAANYDWRRSARSVRYALDASPMHTLTHSTFWHTISLPLINSVGQCNR